MSGEPKTLWEMTPREAWEHAWEQAIDTCRVFEEEATAGRLEVVRRIGRQFLDQDAGVPVVARDEAAELREENKRLSALVDDLLLAPNPLDDENMRLRTEVAELRAAIREWVEATDDAEMFELDQTNAYGDDHIDAEYRLEVARKVLLALAVTEGSES